MICTNLAYDFLYLSLFIRHRYGLHYQHYLSHTPLKIEAVGFYEKLVIFYQFIGRHFPERVFFITCPFIL
jgi:hypothetical protein